MGGSMDPPPRNDILTPRGRANYRPPQYTPFIRMNVWWASSPSKEDRHENVALRVDRSRLRGADDSGLVGGRPGPRPGALGRLPQLPPDRHARGARGRPRGPAGAGRRRL